jgi:hypothetical protein
MTDLKDNNLSPIGRKWDNTPAPPKPKWSLGRAALYGLAASVAISVITAMAREQGLSMPTHELSVVAFLLTSLWVLPLVFVIVAAIRNQYVRD